jgi:choline dehydrogenase-like flavoprotein
LGHQTADVVVVGAGPAGAFAAKCLAEAGFDVVCLEQGDWMDPGSYPGPDPEAELLAGSKWSFDPNVRGLPADYPVNVTDSDVDPLMFNAVGGSSIVFGAHWMRFLPSDFVLRSLTASPTTAHLDDLRPFYERADVRWRPRTGRDPAYLPPLDPPLPPAPAR